MKFILGKKLRMTEVWNSEGKQIPVTLVEAGPCFVTQVKTKEKDGYNALQIGFSFKKNISKPVDGHLKKAGLGKIRFIKEFKADELNLKEGDKIEANIFEEGEIVDVSGISKGKGFAGVVKRWNFRGRSPSHGTKHEERTGGSVGPTYPQRVTPGRKMPGRKGSDRKTLKNLTIVKIDAENNIIAVKGSLPGAPGTLIEIKAGK